MTCRLYHNSEFHPFRFALILAAIVATMMSAAAANSQQTNSGSHKERVVWLTSFAQAEEVARQQDVPILIYFSGSDWCPWTKKLSSEILDQTEFANWSDGRVVPLLVDFPRTRSLPSAQSNQNNSLLERYRPHLTGFPTALFVNPDGTVIGKLGYEPEGLRSWIQKAQAIVGKLDKLAFSFFARRNLNV